MESHRVALAEAGIVFTEARRPHGLGPPNSVKGKGRGTHYAELSERPGYCDGFSASYSNYESVLEVVSGLRPLGPKVSLSSRATRETVNLVDR